MLNLNGNVKNFPVDSARDSHASLVQPSPNSSSYVSLGKLQSKFRNTDVGKTVDAGNTDTTL